MQAFECLLPEQLKLLRVFNEHDVEFTIVGGYAMRCLGHLRQTHDLDIVIKQSNDNIARILISLSKLTGNDLTIVEKKLRKPESKITWHSVEIFSTMTGFIYADIEALALRNQIQEICVLTMSLPHMLRAKELSLSAPERNNTEDKGDIAYLLDQKSAFNDDSAPQDSPQSPDESAPR